MEQAALDSGAESWHHSLTNSRKGGRASAWQHPSLALMERHSSSSVDAEMESRSIVILHECGQELDLNPGVQWVIASQVGRFQLQLGHTLSAVKKPLMLRVHMHVEGPPGRPWLGHHPVAL